MENSWSGFHRLARGERIQRIAKDYQLAPAEVATLCHVSGLANGRAETFIENALGTFPLPLGLAVHFVVDGVPTVVPMAIEESSVVAAASHGAKLAAAGGGFKTKVPRPVTIGQVELRRTSLAKVNKALAKHKKDWTKALNAAIPRMKERGGGVVGMEARGAGAGRVVLHLHVDTRDAMGANTVNTLCEQLAPLVAEATGAKVGLRILTNLATERVVTVTCSIPAETLGGPDAVAGIIAANRFALEDPYRAATHNKGVMNGVDAVLLATGNDWRAVEAGAHAYAARKGRYRALTTYSKGKKGELVATLEMPLSLGTVGGVTRLHPVAQVTMKLLGNPDATRLAAIVASCGLAQNLAALLALSGPGIQAGHMRLHQSNLALAAAEHPQNS